jgi:hypothetical protein
MSPTLGFRSQRSRLLFRYAAEGYRISRAAPCALSHEIPAIDLIGHARRTSIDHRVVRAARHSIGRLLPEVVPECQEERWPRRAQPARRRMNFPTRARLHTVREIGKERLIRWWCVGQAARLAATRFKA